MEKLTYEKKFLIEIQIIQRHETELKWIKLLQTPFPLGLNDNIYHEGNISKMPDFDVFSLLEIRKRKSRSHGTCRDKFSYHRIVKPHPRGCAASNVELNF